MPKHAADFPGVSPLSIIGSRVGRVRPPWSPAERLQVHAFRDTRAQTASHAADEIKFPAFDTTVDAHAPWHPGFFPTLCTARNVYGLDFENHGLCDELLSSTPQVGRPQMSIGVQPTDRTYSPSRLTGRKRNRKMGTAKLFCGQGDSKVRDNSQRQLAATCMEISRTFATFRELRSRLPSHQVERQRCCRHLR
jgi:hypothetical protein